MKNRITQTQAEEIRTALATEPVTEIAKRYGVHHATISKIKLGQIWRKLGPIKALPVKRTSPDEQERMRTMRANGIRIVDVAERFGVNIATVSKYAKGAHKATA